MGDWQEQSVSLTFPKAFTPSEKDGGACGVNGRLVKRAKLCVSADGVAAGEGETDHVQKRLCVVCFFAFVQKEFMDI